MGTKKKKSNIFENPLPSPTSSLVVWPGWAASKANSEITAMSKTTTQNPIPFQSISETSSEKTMASTISTTTPREVTKVKHQPPPKSLFTSNRHLPEPISTVKSKHEKYATGTENEEHAQSDLVMVAFSNYESEVERSMELMPPSYDESTSLIKQTRARYHICKLAGCSIFRQFKQFVLLI